MLMEIKSNEPKITQQQIEKHWVFLIPELKDTEMIFT